MFAVLLAWPYSYGRPSTRHTVYLTHITYNQYHNVNTLQFQQQYSNTSAMSPQPLFIYHVSLYLLRRLRLDEIRIGLCTIEVYWKY
jgi:hypothetical protein